MDLQTDCTKTGNEYDFGNEHECQYKYELRKRTIGVPAMKLESKWYFGHFELILSSLGASR
jgi:hypothetical protein